MELQKVGQPETYGRSDFCGVDVPKSDGMSGGCRSLSSTCFQGAVGGGKWALRRKKDMRPGKFELLSAVINNSRE